MSLGVTHSLDQDYVRKVDVAIVSRSHSATNWQQEVCHLQQAMKKTASYIYQDCFKLGDNNVKDNKRILDISNSAASIKFEAILYESLFSPWSKNIKNCNREKNPTQFWFEHFLRILNLHLAILNIFLEFSIYISQFWLFPSELQVINWQL